MLFLLGSRYCETDRLAEIAWGLFNGTPMGWARVQAICDFVHNHISFGYHHARPTKTAWEVNLKTSVELYAIWEETGVLESLKTIDQNLYDVIGDIMDEKRDDWQDFLDDQEDEDDE